MQDRATCYNDRDASDVATEQRTMTLSRSRQQGRRPTADVDLTDPADRPSGPSRARDLADQRESVLRPSARYARLSRLSHGETGGGNALFHEDNLDVLQEVQEQLVGQVTCTYIDPPYNNREHYRHYPDTLSHEEWLHGVTARLELIRPLLAVNGSLWMSIDDREAHYLKVAADRVFGRENFVSTIVWQQRTTRENRKVFSNNHEYILVYAADPREFKAYRNPLPAGPELLSRYRNPDLDPRGPWQSVSANVQDGHAVPSQYYDVVAPNGNVHSPPEGRCWAYSEPRMQEEIAAGNIWFGKSGGGVPRIKKFLNGHKVGLTPETLWTPNDVGTTDEAKKHLLQLFPEEPIFDTPKPERLLSRILEIATNEGDLVLDAYLGSGTTAAVAHKMNRRYVGIERGEHAITYCAARIRMVIEGDRTGVSSDVGWTGGGGVDFYTTRRRKHRLTRHET